MADLSKELNKELSKDFAYCEDALGRAENAIGNLPSAQPEKRTEKRTETHSCDLIDREAAVDAIYHHLPSVSRTRARTMLHEVPSAQPEPEERKAESTQNVPNDELISRKAAIEAVINRDANSGIDSAEVLKDLPSVQIKRKNGKWIYNSPVTMKCDQCGLVIKDWDWHRFQYCPNCISDMRGERE